MRPLDAEARLTEALEAVGVPVQNSRGPGERALEAWQAFCALAREPADGVFTRGGDRLRVSDHEDADLLLHESYLADGEETYVVSFSRQFSFEDLDGEYAGMNALLLKLVFSGAPTGRPLRAQRWGYAGRHREDVSDDTHAEIGNWAGWVDSWKTAVEASNSFRVLDTLAVRHFELFQGDV